MDQPHLSSQLEYLERRHQEDQEKIAKLQQQSETQAYNSQEQTLRIQKLETELAEAQLTLARVPQLDERVDRIKREIIQVIEQRYDRRTEMVTETGHGLSSQLDNQTKALNELRREVDKTQRQGEQILLARTETDRLNKTVSTFEARFQALNKQLEERARTATYVEEQRRIDISRVAELQQALPKLEQTIETTISKLQMVERQIPQFDKYEIALNDVREEIRRHREHMDFQMAQRERLMKNWSELAEEQERRFQEHQTLMEKYVEHYQLNKRALSSLQEFQERLQREQHQADELQRLAENRQRGAMEKLQADYEQRWQKQLMEWQPQVASLQQDLTKLNNNIAGIEKVNQTINEQIDMILQIIEADIQFRGASAQEWQAQFEALAGGQS